MEDKEHGFDPHPGTRRIVAVFVPDSERELKPLKKTLKVRPCYSANKLNNNKLEMEARVGIEPTMQLLQSRALPLGYPAIRRPVKICFLPINSRLNFNFIHRVFFGSPKVVAV